MLLYNRNAKRGLNQKRMKKSISKILNFSSIDYLVGRSWRHCNTKACGRHKGTFRDSSTNRRKYDGKKWKCYLNARNRRVILVHLVEIRTVDRDVDRARVQTGKWLLVGGVGRWMWYESHLARWPHFNHPLCPTEESKYFTLQKQHQC